MLCLFGNDPVESCPCTTMANAGRLSVVLRVASGLVPWLQVLSAGYAQAGWPGCSGMQPTYFPGTLT